MSRQIDKQRCFKIPKEKLNVFLVQVGAHYSTLHTEAEYVFDCKNHYDVVVNYYGTYPWAENNLVVFAESLTPVASSESEEERE